MKAVRLLLVWGMLVCGLWPSVADAQSWRKALEPTYPGLSLNDIYFRDANHGWTVGSRGLVMMTTDGGNSGSETVIDTLLTLQSVYFVTDNLGFVGANKRTLCKSTDGGATWTKQTVTTIPDTAAVIRSIYFADSARGWILSSLSSTNGRILHTTDGGSTWTLDLTVAASNMLDMSFYSANIGVATGKSVGTLYYTTNGTTWTLAPTPALGGVNYTRSDIRSVVMVDSMTAHATGWGSTVGAQPSIHLKSTDGGATWTYMPQSAANSTYDNLNGIWFKDKLTGVASGGGSIFVRTTDGGVTWVPVSFPSGATVNSVSGGGNNVWMCGGDGILYRSPDLGDTWELQTQIPSATINAMQWTSATVGYAAGFDGILLKTTNAGDDWHASFISADLVSQNVNDISFVNDNVGFAAHSFRMITKTTDGGQSWTASLGDTNAATVSTLGVYFVDANLGYAVGQLSSSNGVVYKTTDGGASWTTKPNVAAKALRGVAFGDASKGVVTGATRTVMFTTDGGATWTASTLNGVPSNRTGVYMRRVRFLTPTTAIAVGDSTILRSTNAGASWDYVATTSKTSLQGLDVANATTAYAAGNGEVWKTTDAGLTWTNIINPAVVSGTLYTVAVDKSGEIWVGAASSTLYTTRTTMGVDEAPGVAASYRLEQNYPNPFNPTTAISYRLAAAGHVSLRVFDMLGREVAMLVNERQTAGAHTVQFNAGRLASGVYLYQVKADGFTQVKKMALVR